MGDHGSNSLMNSGYNLLIRLGRHGLGFRSGGLYLGSNVLGAREQSLYSHSSKEEDLPGLGHHSHIRQEEQLDHHVEELPHW